MNKFLKYKLLEELVQQLSDRHSPDLTLINRLMAHVSVLKYKKGQKFNCHNAHYILLNGLARRFYYLKGKEITSGFSSPYEHIYAKARLGENEVIGEFLELSTIAMIEEQDFEQLCNEFPVLSTFVRSMAEKQLKNAERHSEILRNSIPLERFSFFIQNFPGVAGRIPDQHIASYLGLSRGTLNRVKNKHYTGTGK